MSEEKLSKAEQVEAKTRGAVAAATNDEGGVEVRVTLAGDGSVSKGDGTKSFFEQEDKFTTTPENALALTRRGFVEPIKVKKAAPKKDT